MIDKKQENCWSIFGDAPQKKEESLQALFDYEQHYMELVKKHSPEITMIATMLEDLRKEQTEFYMHTLSEIKEKLKQDPAISNEMRELWLNRLMDNMNRSFELSEKLLTNYMTKKVEEFKIAAAKKLEACK